MQALATMTGAEYDSLPEDEGVRWELFEGERIEMPSANPEYQGILANLLVELKPYLRQRNLGTLYPDVDFAFGPNTRLRPDLAVLLGESARTLDRKKLPIFLPPAIAVEIISPSERRSYSARKVQIYLESNVQEVWHIFPDERTILIYSPTAPLKIFEETDELTSSLLPGWQLPVSRVFED